MAEVISSPEDLINLSLGRIGYKKRIGSIYDGSPAAKMALDVYAQTRDAVLRSFDWGFAERDIALTLLKTAPAGGYTPPLVWSSTYPILPWIYEYGYPTDMVKLRALRVTPVILPEFDPKPITWRIADDNSIPGKCILSNAFNPVAVYTAQVTDLTVWDPGAIETFAAELARRLAPAITSLEATKMETADAQMEGQMAQAELG